MAAYTTIDDPEAYFQVQLYTGNGAANNAITLDGDTAMQPDLVWIKNRDANDSHCLFDSTRGVTKLITTDSIAAETTDTDTLDSFASDGFQVDADVKVNTDTENYVSFNWKESATSGFDIVGFTGNQTARDISHSLSAVPEFMMIYNRDNGGAGTNWHIYHVSNGAACTMELQSTDAKNCSSVGSIWQDTTPTTSVAKVGDNGNINKTGDAIILYLFAGKQGFSKFGSYVGNGNVDGPFVYTGFRPAYVLIKKTNAAGTSWIMIDNERPGYNHNSKILQANDPGAEESSTTRFDLCSNGFKLRGTWTVINNSGDTYIYAAFAEAPFVNSNGVPCNAR